jgi:hypothetical protein
MFRTYVVVSMPTFSAVKTALAERANAALARAA